jgi:predicted ferric reductase
MRAAAWIALYLLLVSSPLLLLLLGDPPPGVEFWWDFSKALGFAAISMMGVQFVLTARFKRATGPYGIDIVYFLHRYLAMLALLFALAHFAIIYLLYQDAAGPLNPLEAPWYMTSGRAALLLFTVAVITSEWRQQLKLEYGLWRYLHIFLATAGFAAGIAHIVGVGYYTDTPFKRALWLSMTLSWILLAIWIRVIKPIQQKRRPYRVADVRDEGGDTWTLALEPEGHPGLKRFKPGQFAWLTLGSSPFAVREHPFSLSSAPEQLPRIEMTIKELGDFTGSIGKTKPGEVAYLDGPHGIFSYENLPAAPGFVFIVGGVGITPVISMLRSMRERRESRPLWLFYANPSWDEATFSEELDAIAADLDLSIVHIVQEPPEGWEGETGYLTEEMLLRYLPADHRGTLHYFLCGPPPMLEAAESYLMDLGVPRRQVHVEIFNL